MLVGCLVLLSGCGQFFPPLNGSSGSGSGGTGSGGSGGTGPAVPGSGFDGLYVLNSNPSLESVTAFSLASGQLTNLNVNPAQLGTLLTTVAINPAGTLLFVSSLINGIYVYVINSDGSLTLGNSQQVVAATGASTMTVDPSGNWLLAVTNTGAGSTPELTDYQINQSNGVLTTGGSISLDVGTASQIVFAPNGTQAFVALGTGGIDSLQFTASNGSITKPGTLVQPLGNGYADNAVAVDPTSTYLYAAETGSAGVRAFTINSDASLQEISGSPYATGLGPLAVLVDATGKYVYVANRTNNNISGFALGSGGALTALPGSPYATGSAPSSLAEDSSGGYLAVACAGGSPDMQVFSIGSASGSTPGVLASASTTSTGSVSPAAATQVVSTPPK